MAQRIDQLLQSCTVKITVPGQVGWGTGFFVAPGLILTCAHVVQALKPDATAQIRWQQQENWTSAELVQLLPKLDLALLQFTSPEAVPCVYLDEEIQVGHELYCFGYPDQDFPNGCPRLGKYNINVGQGQDSQIGDRTYVEINEAAVAAIGAAIQQSVSAAYPLPSPNPPPSPLHPPAVSSLKEAKPMPPANAIFISYRRSDSHDVTGRIYDRLSEHFDREVVFKDVDSIPFGVDFRTHLNQGVGNCLVLIAVIGPTWLSTQDADGHRRIDNPNDWVRAEIETALATDIPVIPLLVGGAHLPKVDELPESLKPLAYRNATQARPDPDFHRDMERLIRRLEEIVGSAEAPIEEEKLSLLQLTVDQRKDLRAALMSAFPGQPQLELMIEDELGESLNQITQGQPNYELAVRDLVKWAEASGKVQLLLEGARRSNPGNPKLQELAKLWLKQ